MGVLTKPLLRATQRLDYEDWEVLLSSIQTDAKFWTKQFLSGSNYVLKGFSVTGFGLANATIVMADATLIMGANTENYSYYVAEVGASNLTVAASSLVANTRNYVELRLVEDDNTPASKVFWDQTANDGEGAEFSQLVDTVTDLAVEVVVSQVGFSGSGDRIPICILDLDAGGLIKGILDRRPMFFRLGTTSSADNDYSWVTQVEPPFSLVLSGGSGTYTAGEVVTFTSGTTATVVTGGTTNITVKLLSNINYSLGDTVVGASSGASRTLDGITESFTGADKSIGNFKDHLNAVMTQIKKIKGTRFWYEANSNSLEGLSYAINSCLVQNPSFTNVRFKWESGALSITDDSGSPANSDALAFLRIWGSSDVLTLTRQDAASAPLSISNGQILFIDLPEGANRTYSNAGSGATNYQTVALSSWTTTDSRYWIAYREGTKLYIRGYGELEDGEEAQIGDPLNANVLAYIGTDESSSEPDYNNEVAHDPRYIANNDSLTLAIANISKQLTEIYGQLQMKANDPVDTTINISSNLNTIKDNTQLNQFLDGRVLDFSGAVIDFDSGDVFEEDGSTPLGDNFTPASITNNHYFWYAITIVADSINANNTVKGKLLVTAASASAASLATAPRATFPTLGLHLGQVWVKKDNSGNLENITQANIVQLNIDAANLPDLTISPFSETITQNAHGFTSGDLGKQLYFDGTDWLLSDPNDPEKLRTHTLIEVVDTDTIRIQKIYKATIPSHGFTVGEYYYDDPVNVGNLTINYPLQGYISPAFYVRDADTIDIFSHTIPIDVHCAVAGGPAGMVSAINDLSDVDTATNPPSDGQVLVWDNGDANWVPGNMVASFATTANDPQAVATAGSIGDIIKSLSTNRYYVKKDNGTTTNWGRIVLDDDTQALTNKTINADLNTITNIDNADIKSGANIAHNKMAALTASKVMVTDGSGVASTSTVDASTLSEIRNEVLGFAVSDETTDLSTGLAKLTFRMPFPMTVTAVRASVNTAPTGSSIIVDINEGVSSILGTKLSIDINAKTSTTSVSPATITDANLADDAEIIVDIDQVGSTIKGKGLKIWLIGTRA